MSPRALVAHAGAERYGSDRVVLESVAGLVEAGYDVIATVPGDGPLVRDLVGAGARVAIVPTVVLRKSLLAPARLATTAIECAARLAAHVRFLRRHRPDVVLVNTVTIPLWGIAARLSGRRSVVHVHEAERSAGRLARLALAAPLLAADAVVANSEFSLDTATRSLPGAAGRSVARRAVVVPNGVAGPEGATPPRPTLDGPLRLVYVGRLSPRKGVAVAVEALGELRRRGVDAQLELVGAVFPGYEWFEADLRARAAEAGIADRVRFSGFVDPVWPRVADADIALVPSVVDEPFGNTAVEAALAIRPVVVSDTSGLREATAGTSARLVAASSPDAIADAVASIAADWPAARTAAVADAEHAASAYGVPAYRARIAAVVGDTNENPRPPRSTAWT